MTNILSTKKLSKDQIQLFENSGLSIVDENFIVTSSVPFKLLQKNELLIFTSQNAVNSVVNSNFYSELIKNNCLCVGIKTKKLLEKKGFNVLEFTDYATELAEIIEEKYAKKSFTFFSGNLRQETLPNLFKKNKMVYNEVVVYETTLKPKKITEKIDGIMFFSPSAIESYLIENEIKNEMCFCIGTTTAKALENKTKNIKIASPTIVESVIELAISHMQNA